MALLGEPETPRDLTSATVHGLKWTYVSTVVTVLLQVAVTAVLARVLTPSAFGLVAMASVFLRFGQYFAQMGSRQALVQKKELSAGDMRTAFTSSLLLGIAFCLLFVALAPLAGLIFPDTPDVVNVTRVMSLAFVIGGLTAPTQGLLQRRFAFRATAFAEIGSYVLGYAVVGLSLAVSGFGAWSLVAASLGQGALLAGICIVLCRADIGLGMSGASFRAIYGFGARVSFIGFAEFIGSNLDTLWAGHFLGAKVTGLYTRATNLATVPLYYFTTSLSRVLLPGYSRIQAESERLRAVFLSSLTVIGAITIPVSWGLAASSRAVITTLLGEQWSAAIPVLAILAAAAPFSLLYHLSAIVCEATARLTPRIVITLCRLVWLTALLGGLADYGIVGIAVAFALSELVSHIAYLVVVRRQLGIPASQLTRVHSVGVQSGIATAAALFGLQVGLTTVGCPAFVVLIAQILTGAGIMVVALAKARDGLVWREIRTRLAQSGYAPHPGSPIGWIVRRMDSFSGTAA